MAYRAQTPDQEDVIWSLLKERIGEPEDALDSLAAISMMVAGQVADLSDALEITPQAALERLADSVVVDHRDHEVDAVRSAIEAIRSLINGGGYQVAQSICEDRAAALLLYGGFLRMATRAVDLVAVGRQVPAEEILSMYGVRLVDP